MSTLPGANGAPPAGAPALFGQVALVTGASGGIGGAIALALCGAGAVCHAVGRDAGRLAALEARAAGLPGKLVPERFDLTAAGTVEKLVAALGAERLDILVHSAGAISYGRLDESSAEDLDALYGANVRAPFELTRACLPLLERSQGQVAFVNSSTGLTPRSGVGLFSMTQHALKALADVLRDEVNARGVKVFSVYPGRTATPRMEKRFAVEGRAYQPEVLLQPEDVASVVVGSLLLPRTAEVTNISIRPFAKSY